MERLTITEALGSVIAGQDKLDPADFVPLLRDMQKQVLDWRFVEAAPHGDVLDLNTAEWIYLHSPMSSDEVDAILMAVFS